jgi:hypothetical protein
MVLLKASLGDSNIGKKLKIIVTNIFALTINLYAI